MKEVRVKGFVRINMGDNYDSVCGWVMALEVGGGV